MTKLAESLQDYLGMRRTLGFKLERPAALLADFVAFADRIDAGTITIELAVTWATQPAAAHRSWWAARLTAVRPFARYMSTLDSATQVPPADLIPGRSRRVTPYLYSPADIAGLMTACGDGRSSRLVGANYRTLIGLLAVTGMRVGEAIRLDCSDLDPGEGLLLIRDSKFGKSREIPLQPTTLDALDTYAKTRDRYCRPQAPALFLSTTGTRLIYKNVHYYFHRLTLAAGLRPRSAGGLPRPHDLRHSFAVNTLLDWYHSGTDVAAKLPLLSAYLGHISPSSTYWYLTATPELLALAAGRLEPDRQARP